MATKMTRKRALELAQECIQRAMIDAYNKDRERYVELAKALAMIEHMARQGELHL